MGGYPEMTLSTSSWCWMRTPARTRAARLPEHVTSLFRAPAPTAATGSVTHSARSVADEPDVRRLRTDDVDHQPARSPGASDLDPSVRADVSRGVGQRPATIDTSGLSAFVRLPSGPDTSGRSQ